jgi:hypothetical protein
MIYYRKRIVLIIMHAINNRSGFIPAAKYVEKKYTSSETHKIILSYFISYEDRLLGDATVDHVRFPKPYTRIIRLDNRDPTKRIHGIGTALMQAIIVDSLKYNNGNVELYSEPSALLFYWKLGFRLRFGDCKRIRKTTKLAKALNERMSLFGLKDTDPEICNDPLYITLKNILKNKLKSHEEFNVFEEAARRPPSVVPHKLAKKIKNAKTGRPDTSKLDGQEMFLPEEALVIWKEIIEPSENLKENLKKLRDLPQPN